MAVKFTDGFDLYTSLSDMDATRQYFLQDVAEGNISIAATGGKYGGGALLLADGTLNRIWKNVAVGASSGNIICASFLFRSSSTTLPTSNAAFFGFGSAESDHTSLGDAVPYLYISEAGRVALTEAGLGSDYATVDINVCDTLWHHIEFAIKIDNSVGVHRLTVDGNASLQDITSGDTSSGGATTNPINRIIFQTNANFQSNFYIDDILIYDDITSGIAGDLTYTSNYPFGEVRIETIQPNGVGTNSAWTPTSGDNYTNVDENVADDDTTTVSSSTATALDTYAFSNLTGTPTTIYGVHIGSVGKASPGATTDIRHYTLSSGSTDESVDIELDNAYQFHQTWVGQDPNTTAAWTESGVNAAEFGIEKQ